MLDEWLGTYGRDALEKRGFKKFLESVDQGKQSISPTHVIDAVYDDIRRHSYALSPRYDNAIDGLTSAHTPHVEVKPEGGWHYRMPTNRRQMGWSTSGETVKRASLNVFAEPDLIQKLDAFCTQHKAYYKTPEHLTGWMERHDPITIYFHEEVTDEMKKKLAGIVQPHVRGHALVGETLMPGIAFENSPSVKDIERVIERAKTLHPDLGEAVRKQAYAPNLQNPNPTSPKLSAGKLRAIEVTLDSFESHASGMGAAAVVEKLNSLPIRSGLTPPPMQPQPVAGTVADAAVETVTHAHTPSATPVTAETSGHVTSAHTPASSQGGVAGTGRKAAASEGWVSRVMKEEKWLGKKGALVGGTALVAGGALYLLTRKGQDRDEGGGGPTR